MGSLFTYLTVWTFSVAPELPQQIQSVLQAADDGGERVAGGSWAPGDWVSAVAGALRGPSLFRYRPAPALRVILAHI